ncbi:centromere protein I-like [Liolophura sinensis]|uniref:centromere protein I-like n=1 Tax=Liolophura sinensis TaxID=3198878 RepID=UPI003158EDA4
MATPRSKGKSGTSRLQDALKGVITAAGQTSRQRNSVQLSLDIQIIETQAKESGLPENFFSKIVDVAASKKFAETVSSKLIKCLIPETVVPQDAVLKAISWMCTNIPSVNTQALLIRWINLVFDYIDGKDKIHALYGIIFYFLDSSVLDFFSECPMSVTCCINLPRGRMFACFEFDTF